MKKITATVAIFGILLSVTPNFAQSRSKNSKRTVENAKSVFYEARAYNAGNATWVSWDMNITSNSIAYDVYRMGQNGFERITETPIPNSKVVLGYLDSQGRLGDTYRIEAIERNGSRTMSAPIASEYVDSLERVAGREDIGAAAVSNSNSELVQSNLVLPRELRNETIKTAPLSDLVAHRLAATQVGVKIGIRKTGVYRVTRAELQAAGFDVAADQTKWQLFANGNELPILVEPAGNYIEFYAKAIDTIESDIAMFYLINGTTAGKRMKNRVARPNTAPVLAQSYSQSFSLKQKVNYIYDILNGEAENYWGSVLSGNPSNITLQLTGIDFAQPTSTISVAFQGFTDNAHAYNVSINGQLLGNVTASGVVPFSTTMTIPTSRLVEGANTLTLVSTAPGDLALFDNVRIDYARRFVADQNKVSFFTQSNQRATVSGFSSANVRLFDITNSVEVMTVDNFAVTQNGATFDINLPAYRSRVYYGVENTGLLTAFSVKPNFASNLASPAHNAEMLIIAHKDLMAEAENWATYRRNQGVSVVVVDVEDVFDEFSYGVSNAKSISDFLLYAKNNWQTPPQYVLLVGDASFDPRNYENLGYQNTVPTKMITTVYIETGSDEGLADFDNDGLSEMAIGRIPAKTPQQVSAMLAKTVAFETPTLQNINRGAIFAYDEPNGFDFAAMSHILRDELPSTVPSVFVDRLAPNSQQTLVTEMNSGKYIANYSGHGTTGNWYGSSFFGVFNLIPSSGQPQLNNGTNYSIFTMLTCLNGYFLSPYNDSLAERLAKYDNGGTAANWASTGKTTPDVQLVMGQRFFNRVGAGSIPRMGDLIKDSKSVVSGGTDVRLSWALIGDPMIKVR